MSALNNRRVALTFLAHPDDAEILCAGTLIRLAVSGWEIHVATVAVGDCGSASLAPAEIAAIRRLEAVDAAEKIGGTYHCLDEQDVKIVCDRETIQKSIDLFRRVGPTLVFTHPRHDYMLDHEQVHLLARAASFSYPIPNASSLPPVDGSSVPWLYYCDPLEGIDPYHGKPVTPSVTIDISSHIGQKTEMLVCHASQREWLRAHHGMDEYVQAMKRHASVRGKEIGVTYAESFVQHRGHAYPTHDLLHEMFGGADYHESAH